MLSSSSAIHNKARMPPSRSRSPPPLDMEFQPFKRWVAWLVPMTVAVNLLMFCITMYVNDCPKKYGKNCVAKFLGRFSFQPLKENPIFGPSSATLAKMGALDVTDVVEKRELWRLIASIWLHAGVVHLLANMLSLLFIGINLEQEFGFIRIGLVYLTSGIGGNILSALFVQNSISVGASGALFGLLGAMLSELITNWTIYANKLAALLTLIVIVLLNMAVGLIPHVDNFAHIGGFISGFLIGFMLLVRPQFGYINQKHARSPRTVTKPKYKAYQYVLLGCSALFLISGFVTALVMLLRGVDGNDHCSWCKYLSCIPTAKWSCSSTPPYCEASVFDNRYNLTCVTNGRSKFFPVTEENSSQLGQLCSQLCS